MGYPNMSYCMCENTLLALRQVVTAMETEGVGFMFNVCEDFMNLSEELQDEYEREQAAQGLAVEDEE
jgi:hypothetical protein